MLRDPDLAALFDQAVRNVETLVLLAYSAGEDELDPLHELRDRLAALKAAYTSETNALTREVLRREVERRGTGVDRRVTVDRRGPELQPTST